MRASMIEKSSTTSEGGFVETALSGSGRRQGLLLPRRGDLLDQCAVGLAEYEDGKADDLVEFGGLEHLGVEAAGVGTARHWHGWRLRLADLGAVQTGVVELPAQISVAVLEEADRAVVQPRRSTFT
jgi:hypothetical protein